MAVGSKDISDYGPQVCGCDGGPCLSSCGSWVPVADGREKVRRRAALFGTSGNARVHVAGSQVPRAKKSAEHTRRTQLCIDHSTFLHTSVFPSPSPCLVAMLVLYETAMGFCLFKMSDSGKLTSPDLHKEFDSPEKANKLCASSAIHYPEPQM